MNNYRPMPSPSQRDEARNPATSPERLDELIRLPGNRGDHDSDAGWCREFVAANPSASADTLDELAADMNDVMARRGAAANPSTRIETVERLTHDPDRWVAAAALERLGQQPPAPTIPVLGGQFVFDPSTGKILANPQGQ